MNALEQIMEQEGLTEEEARAFIEQLQRAKKLDEKPGTPAKSHTIRPGGGGRTRDKVSVEAPSRFEPDEAEMDDRWKGVELPVEDNVFEAMGSKREAGFDNPQRKTAAVIHKKPPSKNLPASVEKTPYEGRLLDEWDDKPYPGLGGLAEMVDETEGNGQDDNAELEKFMKGLEALDKASSDGGDKYAPADWNNDGKVSRKESKQYAKLSKILPPGQELSSKPRDVNEDGKIGSRERRLFENQVESQAMDTNQDGQISPSERHNFEENEGDFWSLVKHSSPDYQKNFQTASGNEQEKMRLNSAENRFDKEFSLKERESASKMGQTDALTDSVKQSTAQREVEAERMTALYEQSEEARLQYGKELENDPKMYKAISDLGLDPNNLPPEVFKSIVARKISDAMGLTEEEQLENELTRAQTSNLFSGANRNNAQAAGLQAEAARQAEVDRIRSSPAFRLLQSTGNTSVIQQGRALMALAESEDPSEAAMAQAKLQALLDQIGNR